MGWAGSARSRVPSCWSISAGSQRRCSSRCCWGSGRSGSERMSSVRAAKFSEVPGCHPAPPATALRAVPSRAGKELGALGGRAADGAAGAAGGGDRGAGGGRHGGALAFSAADILAADGALGFLAGQRLIFEQIAGEAVELVEMLGEDGAGGALGVLDQAADLGVDEAGGLLGDVLAPRDAVAEEHLFLIVAVAQPAELLAHAIFHDHGASEVGRLLNVVGGAGVQ